MRTKMDKQTWFQATIRDQQGNLIRYTQKIVCDESTAKDVVQDGFIKLWGQSYPESVDIVPPWLYRVCRNLAIDSYRKNKKYSSLAEIENHFEFLSSEEEKLMNKEVFLALQSLPKKSCEVMILMFQEGLSYKEIAEVTGLTVSNVGVILHQSLKIIKQKINAELSHE